MCLVASKIWSYGRLGSWGSAGKPPCTCRFAQPRRANSEDASINLKYELYKLDKGPPATAKLTKKDAMYALQAMFYIRRMESKASDMYKARLINGFCHLYSGQEAVAIGLKLAFDEKKDSLITAYRCHGFATLFGIKARAVLAELMGRKTGVAQGKGGSMHMYCPRFYGGQGIVGGQVPLGTGIGLAHKYRGDGGVCFTLYGDGASSQGQIFEAWNMCKLWNLPVVYICENNKYGMGTAIHRHSANYNFYTRGDLIPGLKADGMKVVDVREAIKFAREHALHHGPFIVEVVTYRYFGHSMSDPGTAYRTREEIKEVQDNRDPIKLFSKLLVDTKLSTEKEIQELRKTVFKAVDAEAETAKADPWPEASEISAHVYVKSLQKLRGKVPWETY